MLLALVYAQWPDEKAYTSKTQAHFYLRLFLDRDDYEACEQGDEGSSRHAEVIKSASLCILTDNLLSSTSPFVKLLQPLHL